MHDIHWWLEYRRTLAFGLPLAILLLAGSGQFSFIPVIPIIFQAIGSALISALVVRTLFEFIGRQDLGSTFTLIKAQADVGLEDIVFPVQTFSWLPLFKSSHNIIVVGMRLNFIENPEYFFAIRDVLSAEGHVTIILSDPRSAAMQLRYREEPHPSPYGIDPYGWSDGLEQLCSYAKMLQDRKIQLKNSSVNVNRLKFAVFPHYPSLAIYKFDKIIYVYSYPYKRRGFNGPLLKFRVDSRAGKFFSECLDEIIAASIDIEEVIDDIMLKRTSDVFSDRDILGEKLEARNLTYRPEARALRDP